jgi:thiol-disulfide isomerase/thioredoxin
MQRNHNWHVLSMLIALIALLEVALADERTWTDATGKSTITAELVDVQKGKAVLRQSDGKEITVPLKSLSDADRDFIKKHTPAHPTPDAKTTDDPIAEIATKFYNDLRTTERADARQSMTAKAQEAMKGAKSPLADLPTPEAGNRAIKVGKPEIDGQAAEIPVQVRAGGAMHKTKLHLRREGDEWHVFALSATYHDGEKSLNFEAAAGAQQQSDSLQALVGKPFALAGLTAAGRPLDTSQFKDKVVLVDFWATWCGPCRAEIPNVLANYQKHHNDGFDVIAVSVDQDMDALKTFLAAEQPPWTVVIDNYPGNKNVMAERYGIRAIPAFVLVGKDGKVAAVNCRGELLGKQLERLFGKSSEKVGNTKIRTLR